MFINEQDMPFLDSTIPPEQQAEAKELASVLVELNNNMQHEYQDLVSAQWLSVEPKLRFILFFRNSFFFPF